MALAPQSRIGSYEIVAPLGAGGMGDVYRARDTRLGREVAIKALPEGLARHPERLARFEREARLLASLNHPNIASIFGVEDDGGSPCLVLELVIGESLAQRLARGPLTVRETLAVCGQVAAAIEAAHAGGVVHRDLKPGNVMLSRSGLVKVLDFGLAKSDDASAVSSVDLSLSPTAAIDVTGAGVILGTAAYMSPEQARGKPADRRTDVWSLGCVLYECLAGRQAFDGETVSDLIARILEREPDWRALPAATPAKLAELLRRCLRKGLEERPSEAGALRAELAEIAAAGEHASPASSASRAAVALPSLAVLYFENTARDPESEYFCSGITEDILTDLSKIKGLRVASRNAVVRYRGKPTDLPKVAADLGVTAVLEGSVRRAGDRVRITAQLVNAADGFQLWAERYDRTLADVFAVQEEIASAIAAALRIALDTGDAARLVQDRPADARAYDLYLKGREQYGRYSPESLRRALALFREAITLDPGYALAWAGIGDVYGQMCQWGGNDPDWDLEKLGLEAARRAISLNPRLAEGYKAEALVLRFAGDREGARESLRKALQANPRFTPALLNLAVDAFSRADLAGAERFVRRTLEIDPQECFAMGWLGVLLRTTRRFDEAAAIGDRQRVASHEQLYRVWGIVGRAWAEIGRGDDAAAERSLRELAGQDGDAEPLRAMGVLLAARAGRLEEAARGLGELESSPAPGAIGLSALAATCLRLGQPERAVRICGLVLLKDLVPTLVRLDAGLQPLADLPAFAPRRRDAILVWPLEAPMMDAATHALFREVRVESGQPRHSEVDAR